MQTGPFDPVTWWQINMVANAVNSLSSLSLVVYIGLKLLQLKQLRSNKLALAMMVTVFVLGLHRGLQVQFQVVNLLGPDGAAYAASLRNVWWLALTQVAISVLAVYFFVHRRYYGRLLVEAFLFDSFTQQQRDEALAAQEAIRVAKEEAEGQRDFQANILRTLNQNSHSVVQIKDLEGRYLMVNSTFERTFGVLEKDVLGRTVEAIDPARAAEHQLSEQRARTGVFRSEETVRTPDGLHYFDSVRFPIRDAKGELLGTGGISLDVTELRRTIMDLSVARDAALAAGLAKSEFLATMSHEIRTPMNAVIGLTDLLLLTDMDEDQRELLGTVASSGNALLVLINDILDLAKIEAGELTIVPAPFDLRAVIESCVDVVRMTAASKSLALICNLDDSCPATVVGDAARLRQICINLLANAVKFTGRGEVLLTVRSATAPGGRATLAIEVADTGIGISAEGLLRLFQTFSQVDTSPTRAYGGTGLGLVISRRLARAMGGDITVVSRPGSGSAFTATLIVDLAEQPTAAVVQPPGQARLEERPRPVAAAPTSVDLGATEPLRVLLAEDDLVNQRVAQLMLGRLGHRVDTVADGAAACDALRSGAYDVVLMDVNMPRMNGLEATRRIRADVPQEQQPYIIAVTADAREENRLACMAAGMDDYLNKPVHLEALADVLAHAGGPRSGVTSPDLRPVAAVAEPAAAGAGSAAALLGSPAARG